MKTQATLLGAILLTAGMATAQTTESTSTTTTSYNYTTAPVSSTDATNVSSTTVNTPTNVNDNMTGTYNNAATTPSTNTYGSTTVTTTSTGNDNMSTSNRRDGDDDRSWGKKGKFGVYAGVNASRFVNEPIQDNAYRLGYQIGLYGRSAGTVFGQVGAEFRRSSSNLIRTGTGSGTTVGNTTGQIDQTFLAIPAYVGLRLGGALGVRLQVGAELAALVAVGQNNFQLGQDDLNRTILNGLAGVGINLGPLTLDVNYNHGLQNVFDNGADTKRRMLALNLGFRF
jgi:hypothetical protein